MLDLDHVNRVVGRAAASVLKQSLLRVSTDHAVDSDGHDAFLVTVVLRGDGQTILEDQNALMTIYSIQKFLLDVGEERFPIIDFTTEEELARDVDPEE